MVFVIAQKKYFCRDSGKNRQLLVKSIVSAGLKNSLVIIRTGLAQYNALNTNECNQAMMSELAKSFIIYEQNLL